MPSDANEIIRASFARGSYVKGSATWATGDVIEYTKPSSLASTRSIAFVCRHNDWHGICSSCVFTNMGGKVVSEEGPDPEDVANNPGNVDNVPLWHEGERQAYSGRCFCGGAHSIAEHIEMDDDLKHAGDY